MGIQLCKHKIYKIVSKVLSFMYKPVLCSRIHSKFLYFTKNVRIYMSSWFDDKIKHGYEISANVMTGAFRLI